MIVPEHSSVITIKPVSKKSSEQLIRDVDNGVASLPIQIFDGPNLAFHT